MAPRPRLPGRKPWVPPEEKVQTHGFCCANKVFDNLVRMAEEDGASISKLVVSLILAEHRRREEALKQPNGANEKDGEP